MVMLCINKLAFEKTEWDLVKELCHLEDEGEIPLGWIEIIAIFF